MATKWSYWQRCLKIRTLGHSLNFLPQPYPQLLWITNRGLRQRLQAPLQEGLIAPAAENVWRPTPLGRRFLNDLQEVFLPE